MAYFDHRTAESNLLATKIHNPRYLHALRLRVRVKLSQRWLRHYSRWNDAPLMCVFIQVMCNPIKHTCHCRLEQARCVMPM
jgi:hypothetical protein